MTTIPIHNGTITVSDLIDYARQRSSELCVEARALPLDNPDSLGFIAKANGMLMLAQEIGIAAVKAQDAEIAALAQLHPREATL